MADGIFVVDKPQGWTSTRCVGLVRRLTGVKRVGHAGTLDPMATGVLPVCIGRATRVVEFIHDAPKAYLATLRLGAETDTCDAEGDVIAIGDASEVTRVAVEAVVSEFVGDVLQVPPAFSALKMQGEAAYVRARRGEAVELAARPVRIDAIRIIEMSETDVTMAVDCGRGTYVRALARDVGRRLGCGAHLVALRRTRVGRFCDPVSPDALEARFGDGTWRELLLPLDTAFGGHPGAIFGTEASAAIRMGKVVETPGVVSPADYCVAYSTEGTAIAVLRRVAPERWHPGPVFEVLAPAVNS